MNFSWGCIKLPVVQGNKMIRQNFSADQIFDSKPDFWHFCLPKLFPIRYSCCGLRESKIYFSALFPCSPKQRISVFRIENGNPRLPFISGKVLCEGSRKIPPFTNTDGGPLQKMSKRLTTTPNQKTLTLLPLIFGPL